MDYIVWTVVVLGAMYLAVRLVFSLATRKDRYKG